MDEKLSQEELRSYARLSLDELDKHCSHTMARSSGPGGQSVNTTDSKVTTCFMPDPSIRVVSQQERSQYLNRRANLKKIHLKLLNLSTPTKTRLATKPTKTSKIRRLNAKKRKSALKKSRLRNFGEE